MCETGRVVVHPIFGVEKIDDEGVDLVQQLEAVKVR